MVNKKASVSVCKIIERIEMSHHSFVVAFDM